MNYTQITEGRFKSRPNRFIAWVEIDQKLHKVHVKNTGRCKEILKEDATVYLTKSNNPDRSTVYDLVAAKKGERIINIDSQAPNAAVGEWLKKGGLFKDYTLLKPEKQYESSRFDFYMERNGEKIFIEVKGVTLEKRGAVFFPDAPSQRAVRHVQELIRAVQNGYRAYLLFVVQMEGASYFSPNAETHPEFARILEKAREEGVTILARECRVTRDSMEIAGPVPVRLSVMDEIAAPLLDWYDKNRRILPWREDPAPYHVWVSEIMLQQTRVEAVKAYYERFMKALPDIESLAAADEETLLKLWEGLGYYNRVRNLHKAAQIIVQEYGGRMPKEPEELKKLPGIGSYTAGAVASIAYGKKAPAVDGNVLRVLARLRMDDRDIALQNVKNQIEKELYPAIPDARPGDFNQALMELGAIVCTPGGEPDCNACPWQESCLAHRQGCETDYPVKSGGKERTVEQKTILIIKDEERAALQKRPDKGLLAGMYEFPNLEGHLSKWEVKQWLAERGMKAIRIETLPESRHIFSHKEWHMIGYRIRVDELAPAEEKENMLFVEQWEARDKYPIPSAYKAYRKFFISERASEV